MSIAKRVEKLESENASLRGAAQGLGELCDRYKAENDDLRRLANIDAKLFFLMNQCPSVKCDMCEARHLCEESVYLEGLYGIDKDLA